MTTYHTGRLEITAEAISAIHHGAGTLGNVQILRLEDIVLPDGTPARVPFISGNSLKHMIRDGAVRFAIDAMGVEDGSLNKPVVDLLFSGGHLSKGKASVDIGKARRLSDIFPALGLCGYSAGNMMQASRISVMPLQLVCAENAWRMPEALKVHPHASVRAGEHIGEAFGTRHEASRDPRVRALLTGGDAKEEDGKRVLQLKGKASAKVEGSSQMIYEFEIVKAGSVWWSAIYFRDLPDLELTALKSGLGHSCVGGNGDGYDYRVGAKSSIGYGQMRFRFAGSVREPVRAPVYVESDLPVPTRGDNSTLAGYTEHLREHRDEILEALEAIA